MGLKTNDGYRMAIGLEKGTVDSGFEIHGTVFIDEICNEEFITLEAVENAG